MVSVFKGILQIDSYFFNCSWGVFVFYTFIVASRIIRTIPKNQRKIGEKGLYIMVLSVILWVCY